MLFTLTVKSSLPQGSIIQSLACAVCKDRSNYLPFNHSLEFFYLTRNDYSSREFHNNIWQYNVAFAMTSVGVKIDNSVTRQSGPYCFKIQEELHHLTGALLPYGDQTPIYAQIYILDIAEQLNVRRANNNNLDPVVYHDLANWLSHYLYFFSFLFFSYL